MLYVGVNAGHGGDLQTETGVQAALTIAYITRFEFSHRFVCSHSLRNTNFLRNGVLFSETHLWSLAVLVKYIIASADSLVYVLGNLCVLRYCKAVSTTSRLWKRGLSEFFDYLLCETHDLLNINLIS